MPKKKSHKSSSKYKHFKLHGHYPREQVLIFSAIAFIMGIILGLFLQPYIFNALTAYALGY